MSRRIYSIIILFTLLIWCPTRSHAIEVFEGAWRAIGIDPSEIEGGVLGAGLLYSTSVYAGDDDRVWGVPIIIGKYKRFFISGNSAGLILNDNEELVLSAILEPRFDGYEGGDSTVLNGMQDREWSIDAGLQASWKNEWFLLNLSAVTDLLGRHDGYELKAVVSKQFLEGGVIPRAGVKYQSENIVEYYYGVAGSEVTLSRPSYQGGATVNPFAGITLAYPIKDNWIATADVQYEWVGSEVQDSPIVDEDGALSTIIGIAYRF